MQNKINILSWQSLTLKNRNQKIIDGESGEIKENTLTALLGPSGAGKTSLLNVLAGRVPATLKINGKVLFFDEERDLTTWPKEVAYVEQSFYAYMNQTVYETILFAAKLRLKNDMTNKKDRKDEEKYDDVKEKNSEKNDILRNKQDIDFRVNDIIRSLGLKNTTNTKLKSVSGGELKRVSIGTELMSDPLLLFVDEPTSGLDSFSALNLIELLKEIAERSTILMTVHQPSYKMSTYFDRIYVLSQSSSIFQGTIDDCITFFETAGYKLPENTNPCDYFLDLIAVDHTSEQKSEESWTRINKLKEKWKEHKENEIHEIKHVIHRKTENDSVKSQIYKTIYNFFTGPTYLILWQRNFTELVRDTRYLTINIFQKIVFTLLLGLAYVHLGYSQESITSRTGVIFFILINSLFGTAGPIFNIFPSEKRIIYRERKSGLYDGVTAYIAKYTSLIIFDILFTTPYMTAVYWMTGLNPDAGRFFIFLIIIVSSVLFASSLGLTIGTLSPNEKFAQVLGTTTLIVFIIFGGGFNNPNTIPGWLRWFIWISPVNYAFRGAMNNQYRGLQFDGTTGDEILATQGIDYPGVWSCLFGLWGLTLACILLGSFSLHYLTRIQLKLNN